MIPLIAGVHVRSVCSLFVVYSRMDRYQKIEKNGGGNLGEGTYGVVYKAKDRQTEEIVALKVVDAGRFSC